MKNLCLIFTFCFTCAVCFSQESIPGQTIYSSDFNIDEIPRTCLFYIPLNFEKADVHSLIVMLHDKSSNVKTLIKNYGDLMHAIADSVGAVIIYPSAVATMWNDGSANDSVNDVGYISILIDYFIQRYQCNAGQVYVAGIGNGGSMAMKVGCDIPSKITAVAALLHTGKPPCEKFSLPLLPVDKISLVNGKISNNSIHEMWKFFLGNKKE